MDYTTTGTLFITSENVGNDTLLLEKPKFLNGKINEIQPRSILKKHDVLTNIVGASIGRTCEYTLDTLSNINQAVAIIRMVDICFSQYIVRCLNSKYCISLMLDNQVDMARANLSLSSLSDFLIPLPPVKEQNRIVKQLKNIFVYVEKINSSQKDINEIVGLTKSKILDLAIRGQLVPQDSADEPASVLLERIKAEKEELIKQGKIKRDKKESVIFKGDDNSYYEKIGSEINDITDEIPFDIPDNWSWCRGYSCFSGMKSTKPSGDTFKYIDIESIDNKVQRIRDAKTIETDKAPSRASRDVDAGSVLFSFVRPYLKNIAYVSEEYADCIASTGFYVCNSNGALDCNFMYYLMISDYVVKGLNQFMKGDNSPSITKDNLEDWLYPIPPLTEQQEICKQISTLYEFVSEIEKSLN